MGILNFFSIIYKFVTDNFFHSIKFLLCCKTPMWCDVLPDVVTFIPKWKHISFNKHINL